MTIASANSPMGEISRARFLVNRVVLSGRGFGDDTEDREEPIFENRLMSLWETVAELASCDEPSCSRHVEALIGSEHAMTVSRRVDGWDETEIVLVRRADGSPISGRMLLWLYRAAGLVWGPKRETVAVVTNEEPASRDIVEESLADTAATAKLWNKPSLHLVLERVLRAYSDGTIDEWAKQLELESAGTGDHPKIEDRIQRREALASLGVAG